MDPGKPWRALGAILISVSLVPAWGCGSTKMTNTARTGTEQLLLTNAYDRAIQNIDFRPLTGVPVFLDTSHVKAVDEGWIISGLRQAMLAQGVLLRGKAEEAQWVVEARIGAYGTDEYNFLIGVPEANVPATIPGLPAGRVPEIPVIKKSDQHAISKLALFAYDRASGQLVWNSGTMLGTANAKDLYVGGLGPIQGGSIRGGTEFYGVKITNDPKQEEEKARQRRRAGRGLPFTDPAIRTAAGASDHDSFAP